MYTRGGGVWGASRLSELTLDWSAAQPMVHNATTDNVVSYDHVKFRFYIQLHHKTHMTTNSRQTVNQHEAKQ